MLTVLAPVSVREMKSKRRRRSTGVGGERQGERGRGGQNLAPGTSILAVLQGLKNIPETPTSCSPSPLMETAVPHATKNGDDLSVELDSAVVTGDEKEGKLTFKEYLREELAKKKKKYYEAHFKADTDEDHGKEVVKRFVSIFFKKELRNIILLQKHKHP